MDITSALQADPNIDVPVNAQYIRNIILAAHTTHDHIVHFYQLSALDWVDITSALQADPAKASEMLKGVSTWHLNSPEEFTKVQNKIKDLVASGQLGIFANGYWGHPAMKLPPEVKFRTRSKIWLPAVSWVFSPMATGGTRQ